jgi:phosphoribosyl 1,2-cyclic phosphodiesterase
MGSGSRGNGTLVEIGGELILVDCGFTLKQAEARLARLDVRPGDLSAILVTHEHSDHVGGVPALAYKYAVPAYASWGTLKAAGNGLIAKTIDSHAAFAIGSVTIHPVVVPHDAREPTQFVFEHDGTRVGVISDLGQVTPFVTDQYANCQGLMMEANYDPDMLQRGRYPASVKRRIGGALGHLSNDQSVAFLEAVAHLDLQVVVGHVSEENNHPDLLQQAFAGLRDRVASLEFATQQDGMAWLEISRAGNASAVSSEYATPALG